MQLAVVTVVIGQEALQLFEIAEPFFKKYAAKVHADFLIINEKHFTHFHASNLEKFQIYNLFDIYDRILYVDVDILISPRTPNVFAIVPETHIGAVYDNKTNNENDVSRQKEIKDAQQYLGNINWDTGYINSGVIVLSKIHRNIFLNAELRKKMKSAYNDQTLINYNIKKNQFPIYKLHTKFNGMQINGFTSRKINPKNKSCPSNNKTSAFILHFAGETDKVEHMQKTALQLLHQIGNNINLPQVNKHIPRWDRRLMRRHRVLKLKLFYDISELGWSMYLAAHIKFLHKHNEKTGIITTPGKFVLYRDCVNLMLPLPNEYIQTFGHLPSDGNHLFDPLLNIRLKNHQILSAPFKKAYPQHKNNIITTYSKFTDQQIFEPYKHSRSAVNLCQMVMKEYKNSILIFPRCRPSKFQSRNIPKLNWEIITDELCTQYKGQQIIAIGTKDGAYTLNINQKNFVDLVGFDNDKTLDMLIAFCNMQYATAAVGNQSGTVKITLLCGTPTFIIGDEKQRHQVDENWANTKCGFYECSLTSVGYTIKDLNDLTTQIITFINSCLK